MPSRKRRGNGAGGRLWPAKLGVAGLRVYAGVVFLAAAHYKLILPEGSIKDAIVRFAEVDNQFFFIAGVDAVRIASCSGYAPTIFSGVGIDPETKKILVVKSTQHFHAGFDPISAQLLYAGDLGALPGDMKAIPYERADTSRLWPFVEDPFAKALSELAD